MDVTIIIVNWNTSETLRKCLSSVYQSTKRIDYEVIVIDNASQDGSPDMIKAEFPQVHLVQNKKNAGFAAANNQGMAIAKGRYVLLLNSDTVILKNAIYKTVKFADAHPEAAVIGCRVLNPDRSLQPTCFMFPSVLNMILSCTYLYKLFPRNKFFGRERMTWWDRRTIREVDVVTGCFMLVRREAIESVGMMDEQFFMYGEETDWCYRFKQAGWKILFTPDAEIIHIGGQTSKYIRIEAALQLRGSILRFIRKHYSLWQYTIACFLIWLFFFIRIPVWFLKLIFSKRSRPYCLERMIICIRAVYRITTAGGKALCIRQP